MSDLTVERDAVQPGDPQAPVQLLPLAYADLRRLERISNAGRPDDRR
jgi:hypothetical protein